MVSAEECCKDAERRVKRGYGGWIVVTKAYQTDKQFVFSLGSADGEPITANLEMHVYDKATGRHHEVRLPSKEGFEILANEKPLEM